MGCNCKKDSNGVEINDTSGENIKSSVKKKDSFIIRGVVLVTKIGVFLFGSIIATIIVIPFSIYMLWKVIFLNEGIDVTDSLMTIGKAIKNKSYDDDEDDFEFEDEDEIEVLDANQIID